MCSTKVIFEGMPVDGSMYVEIGLPCAAAPVRHASKRSEFFICVEPKRFDHKFTRSVSPPN